MTIYQIISLFLAAVATAYYLPKVVRPSLYHLYLPGLAIWTGLVMNAVVAFLGIK